MGVRPGLGKQQGDVKGFDPAAFGEAGIGQKDLTELRKRGYGKKQISRFVESERAKGTQIGGRVQDSLDLMNQRQTQDGPVTGFDPKQYGQEGFGFEDVKELARRGYGKYQIQDYVKDLKGQGVQIGERVGDSLGYMGSLGGRDVNEQVKGYDFKAYGDGKGFGLADIKELTSRGYSGDAIRSHMEDLRGQGVQIGERAERRFDRVQDPFSQDRMDAVQQEIENRKNAKNQAEGLRLAGSVFKPVFHGMKQALIP